MKTRPPKANVKVLALLLALFAVMVLMTGINKVYAEDTEYTFAYTITATGTQDVFTYPNQSFSWGVTTTGIETWTETVELRSGYIELSGYHETRTTYLSAPEGKTITGWDHDGFHSLYGGSVTGVEIDHDNNRLVIEMYCRILTEISIGLPRKLLFFASHGA